MRKIVCLGLLVALVGAGCRNDTPTTTAASPSPKAESPSPAPAEEEQDYAEEAKAQQGTWTGQWKNQTFGSTGSAKADVTVDEAAKTVTIVLDLGGSVFGERDPDPVTFTGSLDGRSSFQGNNSLTGAYQAELSEAAMTMTFSAPDVPGDRVQSLSGSAKIEGNTLTAEITITFPDGSNAKSTLEMTKG